MTDSRRGGIWGSRPTIREICLSSDHSAKHNCPEDGVATAVRLRMRDGIKEVFLIRLLAGNRLCTTGVR